MRALRRCCAVACDARRLLELEGDTRPRRRRTNPSTTVDEVERGIAAKQPQAVDRNHDQLRKKLGVAPGAILSPSPTATASAPRQDREARVLRADPG
jgi:hypothetical protein